MLLEAKAKTDDSDGAMIDDRVGKLAAPKIEVKSTSDLRREDLMFEKFIDKAEERIRENAFRLSGLYFGKADQFNRATADIAETVSREQLFSPYQQDIEEVFNQKILPELGVTTWKFKLNSATVANLDDILAVLPVLVDGGAISVNELILLANRIFNLELTVYDPEKYEWATLPIPLITMMEMKESVPGEGGGTNKAYMSIIESLKKLDADIQKQRILKKPKDFEWTDLNDSPDYH
jgi:capsid portal protein